MFQNLEYEYVNFSGQTFEPFYINDLICNSKP